MRPQAERLMLKLSTASHDIPHGEQGPRGGTRKGQKRCQQEMDKGQLRRPAFWSQLAMSAHAGLGWPTRARCQGLRHSKQTSWRSVMFQAGPEPEQAPAMLGRRVAGSLPKSPKPGGFRRQDSSRASSPGPGLQPNLGSLSQLCQALAAVLNGTWVFPG